jgi:hypothetical protein
MDQSRRELLGFGKYGGSREALKKGSQDWVPVCKPQRLDPHSFPSGHAVGAHKGMSAEVVLWRAQEGFLLGLHNEVLNDLMSQKLKLGDFLHNDAGFCYLYRKSEDWEQNP